MAPNVRQEMPPPGGYDPISWAKRIPKPGLSGYMKFGILFGVSALGYLGYLYQQKRRRIFELDNRDAFIALEPLFLAERHRMVLRQLRSNRDEEAELMKDVPGWEVGKYKGEPVYWNVAGRFPRVHLAEYYAHNSYNDMYGRAFDKLWRH